MTPLSIRNSCGATRQRVGPLTSPPRDRLRSALTVARGPLAGPRDADASARVRPRPPRPSAPARSPAPSRGASGSSRLGPFPSPRKLPAIAARPVTRTSSPGTPAAQLVRQRRDRPASTQSSLVPLCRTPPMSSSFARPPAPPHSGCATRPLPRRGDRRFSALLLLVHPRARPQPRGEVLLLGELRHVQADLAEDHQRRPDSGAVDVHATSGPQAGGAGVRQGLPGERGDGLLHDGRLQLLLTGANAAGEAQPRRYRRRTWMAAGLADRLWSLGEGLGIPSCQHSWATAGIRVRGRHRGLRPGPAPWRRGRRFGVAADCRPSGPAPAGPPRPCGPRYSR
jgi:hypothetical protein